MWIQCPYDGKLVNTEHVVTIYANGRMDNNGKPCDTKSSFWGLVNLLTWTGLTEIRLSFRGESVLYDTRMSADDARAKMSELCCLLKGMPI